jgi:hypothetical protein
LGEGGEAGSGQETGDDDPGQHGSFPCDCWLSRIYTRAGKISMGGNVKLQGTKDRYDAGLVG